MGHKPTHKITLISDESLEPGGVFQCNECGIHFFVDPCTEENCVRTDTGLESCCPQDPANGDYDREFWIEDGMDRKVYYFGIKGTPSTFSEYHKRRVERFTRKPENRCSHQHDCCGCWFTGEVGIFVEKDGWVIYQKSVYRNV